MTVEQTLGPLFSVSIDSLGYGKSKEKSCKCSTIVWHRKQLLAHGNQDLENVGLTPLCKPREFITTKLTGAPISAPAHRLNGDCPQEAQ